MINFFKKYNYDIVKVQMNQFCIALISAVMTFFSIDNSSLFLITNLGCAILYVYIMYTMFYELGQGDKPAIDGNRSEYKPLKGLWISVTGHAICIICGIMVAVFSFFVVYQSPVAVYDENGNEMVVYAYTASEAAPEGSQAAAEIDKDDLTAVTLYSNEGGEVTVKDYDRARECTVAASTKLYDKDGNALRFYSDKRMELTLSSELSTDHWASDLYSIPKGIAIFLQTMFVGFKDWFSNTLHISPDFYYLITPILPIAFSAIGYCNGARGRRILFFLPERKQKPKY